jgi:biopolymer transport protein ExbB
MTDTVTLITPWQFLVKGGPMMWPLLACSVATLTVLVRKSVEFVAAQRGDEALKDAVIARVRKNDIQGAVAACDAASCSLAPVLRSGLIAYGAPAEQINAAMEQEARHGIFILEQGLGMVAAITRLAPLLGFLGTVLGLCGVFHAIQIRAAALNPATPGDVAAGVWQALIATAAGLATAAMALLVHEHCAGRIMAIVARIERMTAEVVEAMAVPAEPAFDVEKE